MRLERRVSRRGEHLVAEHVLLGDFVVRSQFGRRYVCVLGALVPRAVGVLLTEIAGFTISLVILERIGDRAVGFERNRLILALPVGSREPAEQIIEAARFLNDDDDVLNLARLRVPAGRFALLLRMRSLLGRTWRNGSRRYKQPRSERRRPRKVDYPRATEHSASPPNFTRSSAYEARALFRVAARLPPGIKTGVNV